MCIRDSRSHEQVDRRLRSRRQAKPLQANSDHVSYLVKKVGRGRTKCRLMTPVEFLARLAALIPPPKFPLVRFAGVLAPRSKCARVVPQPPTARPERAACVDPSEIIERIASAAPAPAAPAPMSEPAAPSAVAVRAAVFAEDLAAQSDALEVLAPNILSLGHWARLHNGELYAAQPRVDWASLLRRTFDVDVKTCPKCSGRLEVRALVTDPMAAAAMLERLARPRAPPRAA